MNFYDNKEKKKFKRNEISYKEFYDNLDKVKENYKNYKLLDIEYQKCYEFMLYCLAVNKDMKQIIQDTIYYDYNVDLIYSLHNKDIIEDTFIYNLDYICKMERFNDILNDILKYDKDSVIENMIYFTEIYYSNKTIFNSYGIIL